MQKEPGKNLKGIDFYWHLAENNLKKTIHSVSNNKENENNKENIDLCFQILARAVEKKKKYKEAEKRYTKIISAFCEIKAKKKEIEAREFELTSRYKNRRMVQDFMTEKARSIHEASVRQSNVHVEVEKTTVFETAKYDEICTVHEEDIKKMKSKGQGLFAQLLHFRNKKKVLEEEDVISDNTTSKKTEMCVEVQTTSPGTENEAFSDSLSNTFISDRPDLNSSHYVV